jgi:hypothetical protein
MQERLTDNGFNFATTEKIVLRIFQLLKTLSELLKRSSLLRHNSGGHSRATKSISSGPGTGEKKIHWEGALHLILHQNSVVADKAAQFFSGLILGQKKTKSADSLNSVALTISALLSAVVVSRYFDALSSSPSSLASSDFKMEVEGDGQPLAAPTPALPLDVPLQCLCKLSTCGIDSSAAVSSVLSLLSLPEDGLPSLGLLSHHLSLSRFLYRLASSRPSPSSARAGIASDSFGDQVVVQLREFLSVLNRKKSEACRQLGKEAEIVYEIAHIMVCEKFFKIFKFVSNPPTIIEIVF